MPRQAAFAVENNFKNGLITEATGLNFPENACTETYDCIFSVDGSVYRRPGFDFELGNSTKNINRTDAAISSYLWRNVAGDGDLSLFVVQVGATVYFYKTNQSTLSGGAVATTVTLTAVSGAPSPATVEAQFADGNGILIITHPYCEPMRVSYDTSTDTATATNIVLKIRDFEGDINDPNGVDTRPTSTLAALDERHYYNLLNQGWTATNLTAWDTARTDMPSNADVMWRFKNSSNAFDASTVPNVVGGNSQAPKGHYILTLSSQARTTASGLAGATNSTTGSQRPSTCAFFAGRAFYAGINYTGYNSKIYFTQIIERPEQYGFCYQVNDPTAEDLFDLLPSDGGVISIPDAGTVLKLVSIPGGLAVFAANGVWFVTGSQGIGFTANDYTVQKISSISTLTASSFVDVNGFPSWWNTEGIYILTAGSNNSFPSVQSLTDGKIKSFYKDLPLSSKRFARGFYHVIENRIQWLFKSTSSSELDVLYEFDRILNFDTQTGSFYPWTISNSDVKVHAIVVNDSVSGQVEINNVIRGADNIVDGSGNQVITFSNTNAVEAPLDKYLVSYANGATYTFTFAEAQNTDYIDWFQYDTVGVNYDSYFISGYRIRGEGLRKFQSNWLRVFSRIEEPVSYYIQGIWDYANTGSNTGRWSSRQLVEHEDTNYDTAMARRKIRGHGVSLQFRVESVDGEPFDIIGWSSFDSVNALP